MRGRVSIAYFITPHGFGHAARAAAVMNAIAMRLPGVEFLIFTQVPEWLFQDSLSAPFTYYAETVDIGMAQVDPLTADLEKTLRRLDKLYPVRAEQLERITRKLIEAEVQIVFSDTSAMGIVCAKAAGIRSVLVENFTWDWIYAGYADIEPGFQRFIDLLQGHYSQADYHIQTTPVCEARRATLTSNVVARAPQMGRNEVRAKIGIDETDPMVLITMGGIEQQYPFLKRLIEYPEVTFVIPAAADGFTRSKNLILLPHHTPLFHPDLVYASDAVIGKVGYSTLAEVYHAGVPFGYIPRAGNREMGPLVRFIQGHIPGMEINDQDFLPGRWVEKIPNLLRMGRLARNEENGGEQIAQFCTEILA